MHFSGFAAGLKAAFAAMALLAASPAVAQGDSALGRWMVTASPGTYNNGTSYCTLQNSNTRPIIEFTIMGYRDGRVSFVGIAADQFLNVPERWHATFRFPSGEEVTKAYRKRNAAISFTTFGPSSFMEFVQHLDTSGTLTVEIEESSVSFAVHDVGTQLPVLSQCADTLPLKP